MEWIAILTTFPLPILLLGMITCGVLLLAVIILVACIPSASERLIRVLVFFREAFYDGQTTKHVHQAKRQPSRSGRRK